MKLALASDLHLEFGQILLENPGVDALILSGDIILATVLQEKRTDANSIKLRERFTSFFRNINERFPQIFYVMGNHEHYHGDFRTSATIIREFLTRNGFNNVTLLDNEALFFKDHLIFGSTLWSDFNRGDPLSMVEASRYMNDFKEVIDSSKPYEIRPYQNYYSSLPKLTVETVLDEHRKSVSLIREKAQENPTKKMIVIGHHSPSFQSVHKDYAEDKYVNGAYHSNLEYVMHDHRNIVLWTHGHTHYPFDYHIKNTNVVCNPRGYAGYEHSANVFQLKIINL